MFCIHLVYTCDKEQNKFAQVQNKLEQNEKKVSWKYSRTIKNSKKKLLCKSVSVFLFFILRMIIFLLRSQNYVNSRSFNAKRYKNVFDNLSMYYIQFFSCQLRRQLTILFFFQRKKVSACTDQFLFSKVFFYHTRLWILMIITRHIVMCYRVANVIKKNTPIYDIEYISVT